MSTSNEDMDKEGLDKNSKSSNSDAAPEISRVASTTRSENSGYESDDDFGDPDSVSSSNAGNGPQTDEQAEHTPLKPISQSTIDEYTQEALSLSAPEFDERYMQIGADWFNGVEGAAHKKGVFDIIKNFKRDVETRVGAQILSPNYTPEINGSISSTLLLDGGQWATISVNISKEEVNKAITAAKENPEKAIDAYHSRELEPARLSVARRLESYETGRTELFKASQTDPSKKEEYFQRLRNIQLAEQSLGNIDHLINKYESKKKELSPQKQEVTQTANNVNKEQLLQLRMADHNSIMENYNKHKAKHEEAFNKYEALLSDKQAKADNFDSWYEKLNATKKEVINTKDMMEACAEDLKENLKRMEKEGLVKPPMPTREPPARPSTTNTANEKQTQVKPPIPARPGVTAAEFTAKLSSLSKQQEATKTTDKSLKSTAQDNAAKPTTFTKQSTKLETSVVAQGMDKVNLNAIKKIVSTEKVDCKVIKRAEGHIFTGRDAVNTVAKAEATTGIKGKYKLHMKNCDESMAMVKLGKALEKGLDITKCTFTTNGKTQEISSEKLQSLKEQNKQKQPELSAPEDGSKKNKGPR